MPHILKVLALSISLLLLGCNPIESFQFGEGKSNSTHHLTVQTIESSSKNAVTNIGVTLIDTQTERIIGKEVNNNEGKVSFSGLEQNKTYKIIIHDILPSGEWVEQTNEIFVYDETDSVITIETNDSNQKLSLNVPVVLQNPELPNGCEITSLAAVLNYYGLNVDKVTLANQYLPTQPIIIEGNILYGPDPNIAYAGDPAQKTGAYYAFPLPIVEAANNVLVANHSELRALDIPNTNKEEIIDFLQSGVPVIAWITIDYQSPRTNGYWIIQETGEKHSIYSNLHVVVITGYQNGKVSVMNPLTGYEQIDEDLFFNSFQSLGSQGIVIL